MSNRTGLVRCVTGTKMVVTVRKAVVFAVAVLFFGMCFSISYPAMAEQQGQPPPGVLADMDRGDKAYASANFADAYAAYTEALAICMKVDPPPVFTGRMCGTGMHEATVQHYQDHGNFVVLELMDKKTRAELARDLGASNLQQMWILDNLARLYESRNQTGKAEGILKDALALAKSQKTVTDSLIPDRTRVLIKFYEKHNENDKAEVLHESLLGMNSNGNSAQSTRETLARMYQKSGKFKEAENHWLQLLPIAEATYLKSDCIYPGPNSFKEAFVALVDGYLKQGEMSKAEQLCLKELTYKESLQKASKYYHPWYGNEGLEPMLSMLAKCYEAEHNYKKAEELYQRLLMIYEHADGEKVVAVKQSYAAVLGTLHRTDESLAMNEFIAQAKQDKLRPEPNISSAEVASWRKLADQGRESTRSHNYAEAEKILQLAQTRANAFDPPGDYGCRTLYYLGENYYHQNKMAEAEQYYKKALKLAETIYGQNHTSLSLYLGGLSGLYWWQRKFAEAAPLYQRELSLRRKEEWPGSPKLSTSMLNLGQCLYMEGKKTEAMNLFNNAVAFKQHWCTNRETASTLKHIGTFLKSQNDSEADSFVNRAQTLRDS